MPTGLTLPRPSPKPSFNFGLCVLKVHYFEKASFHFPLGVKLARNTPMRSSEVDPDRRHMSLDKKIVVVVVVAVVVVHSLGKIDARDG